MTGTHLPKIGGPATRAFANVGITTLEDLSSWTEHDLLALHGVGPRAIKILQPVMGEHGVTFLARSPPPGTEPAADHLVASARRAWSRSRSSSGS